MDALINEIKAVATKNKDTFIPTKELVAKNYEEYLPNYEDIHLSKVGYQAVAKEFWSKINK